MCLCWKGGWVGQWVWMGLGCPCTRPQQYCDPASLIFFLPVNIVSIYSFINFWSHGFFHLRNLSPLKYVTLLWSNKLLCGVISQGIWSSRCQRQREVFCEYLQRTRIEKTKVWRLNCIWIEYLLIFRNFILLFFVCLSIPQLVSLSVIKSSDDAQAGMCKNAHCVLVGGLCPRPPISCSCPNAWVTFSITTPFHCMRLQ